MLSRYVDATVSEGSGAYLGPLLEFSAVWLILDVADHKIEEVAVFMGDDVDEAVFTTSQQL